MKQKPTVADLIKDSDDLSLKILSMYQHKAYLPHNKRVSNIAWRIQNQKAMKRHQGGVEKPAFKRKSIDVDDHFDYVAHIRRISQEDTSEEPKNEPRLIPSATQQHHHQHQPSPQKQEATPLSLLEKQSNANPNLFLSSYISLLELTLKQDYKLTQPQGKDSSKESPLRNYTSNNAQAATLLQTFLDFQQPHDGQNNIQNGPDEMDKLLNMNLFQLDSFTIGADDSPLRHVDFASMDTDAGTGLAHLEATDEILIDEPSRNGTWNWLDFGPATTTGGD